MYFLSGGGGFYYPVASIRSLNEVLSRMEHHKVLLCAKMFVRIRPGRYGRYLKGKTYCSHLLRGSSKIDEVHLMSFVLYRI